MDKPLVLTITTRPGDIAMPLILWGSTGFTSTAGDGKFLCPQCGNQQRYEHKQITRYFTLYFIPLFPIGGGMEYIECQKCQGTYEMDVLELSRHHREER
jgi:hypothetical protein